VQQLCDFGELVLKVVDPDIADVCSFVVVPLQICQLVLVVLLEEQWFSAIKRLLLGRRGGRR
jgi:hypothetical protein